MQNVNPLCSPNQPCNQPSCRAHDLSGHNRPFRSDATLASVSRDISRRRPSGMADIVSLPILPGASSTSNFQLCTKQLFLTYPQCPIDKEQAYDILCHVFGDNLELLLVAKELHANGDPHLHVYARLKETLRIRDSKFADLTCPVTGTCYHGNYQGCRSAKNVLKYCTKKDDFKSNFDIGNKCFLLLLNL